MLTETLIICHGIALIDIYYIIIIMVSQYDITYM